MAFDYSKLRGKIREVFKTQSNFANAMKFSNAYLSAKMNNSVNFTQGEIERARSLLAIDSAEIAEYFFKAKV